MLAALRCDHMLPLQLRRCHPIVQDGALHALHTRLKRNQVPAVLLWPVFEVLPSYPTGRSASCSHTRLITQEGACCAHLSASPAMRCCHFSEWNA